jgi:hypothetical protein
MDAQRAVVEELGEALHVPRAGFSYEGPPEDDVIQTPDHRLRLFVSSTLGELADERQAVARVRSRRCG